MGKKTSTSTSQVSIPQDVLARYNSVNAGADKVAQTPFQQYSTSPDAFVAPINAEQSAGIAGTNNFAGAAQPYIGAATDYTVAGGQAVNPGQLDIGQYLSPYLSTVLGSTAGLINQNNQQQQSGQLGDAIRSGGFGGDRAGIAAANLEQQQNLGNANIYSGIANSGFNTALSAAQQQQGVGLQAGQANRQALQQTGQTLAQLGTTAQTAGLQGAQAEQAAGATQQQTEQAGKTALYNQFLQQQSYPFQVQQFLANIAEGTGALSGSTTTTTQPQSIFSDARLKEDVKVIGKTFGGENVVQFRYKGDPTTRMGLIAQDVEKRHPEAVHEVGGFKAVDYGKATDADAEKGHFRRGGLVPANDHYAAGGEVDPESEYERATGTYGPYAAGGLYGAAGGNGQPRGGLSYVPSPSLPVGHLMVAAPAAAPESTVSQASDLAKMGSDFAGTKLGQKATKSLGDAFHPSAARQIERGASGREHMFGDETDDVPMRRGGFARIGRDMGGATDPYAHGLDIPDEKPKTLSLQTAKTLAQPESGFGQIVDLAAKVLPFIPGLAAGGGIRKGYDDGGAVDPNTSWNPLDGLSEIAKQLAPEARADPAKLVPPTDLGTAAIHYGMKAGSAAAHALQKGFGGMAPVEQSAMAGAMAGDGPFGVAGGAMGADLPDDDGAGIGAHAGAGAGTAFAGHQPSAARHSPHVAAALRAARGRPSLSVDSTPEATAATPAATMTPGIDANPDIAAAPNVGRLQMPAGGAGDSSNDAGGRGIVQDALSRVHGFHLDRDTILPILSAIAAAGAVPTVHPGQALAAGLGAYANSVMGLKQQEAEIGRTQAETYAHTQPAPPPGTQPVPGVGPNGQSFVGPDGKPWHYGIQGDAIGEANPGLTTNAAGAAVPVGTVGARPAISSDYKTNTVSIGPSSDTLAQLQADGFNPGRSPVANRAVMFAKNPALAGEDAAGMKLGQDAVAAQPAADNTQRNLIQLAVAVNSLPKSGIQAPGAGYDYRQQLANVYQTATSILGLPADPGVSAATDASQIIEKIKTLSGVAMANQNDERAASVAHALTAVLPGGSHQIGAADEVLANMMVNNQRERDFARYFHDYVAKTGMAAGVQQAFQRDFNPYYMNELKALPNMFRRRADGKQSPFEMLLADPSRTEAFERGGKRSDGTSYPGFGEGIARYGR